MQKSSNLGLWPIVSAQLALGADPDGPDRTPLIESIMGGHDRIATCLVKHGADIERWFGSGDANGSALAWALMLDRREIALMLMKAGSRVDDAARTRLQGSTMLHLAAKSGDLRIVREIIKRGGDVNEIDSAGQTPLHIAAQLGHVQVAEQLVRDGAKVNLRDRKGATPLRLAKEEDQSAIAKTLRRHGAVP